jgi:mannose-1-phosphate guanylyltransferase
MTNIILCGGSGTRLWPISRPEYPKQFCKLYGSKSLFQATVERNSAFSKDILVVTNAAHAPLAEEQLQALGRGGKASFVLEPVGRNTAPALALACLSLPADEIVLVTPSDHVIRDEVAYRRAVEDAVLAAQSGLLVTFGLEPEYPETGFGYIEAGEPLPGIPGRSVSSFREKPSKEKAESYCREGNFFWNSGMFCFKAGAYLSELERYAPDILEASEKAYLNGTRPLITAHNSRCLMPQYGDMAAIRAVSIDYAVMERTEKAGVIPCSIGWNDVGSFDALYDISEKDEAGNVLSESSLATDSRRNLVLGDGKKVVLVGLEDCIVVDTPDALLVVARGKSQGVKKAVEKLEKAVGC